MSLPIAVVLLLAFTAMIVFIVARNRKDRKKLEEDLSSGYKKPRDNEGDINIEERDSV